MKIESLYLNLQLINLYFLLKFLKENSSDLYLLFATAFPFHLKQVYSNIREEGEQKEESRRRKKNGLRYFVNNIDTTLKFLLVYKLRIFVTKFGRDFNRAVFRQTCFAHAKIYLTRKKSVDCTGELSRTHIRLNQRKESSSQHVVHRICRQSDFVCRRRD